MTHKKMILSVLAAVLCMALFVGCGAPAAEDPAPAPVSDVPADTSQSASGKITAEEAKTIALNHSGVAAADARFVRADYEFDDNSYEIEFYADNVEYDYEISAVTGEIIGYDSEIEGFTIGDNTVPDDNGIVITEEEAQTIALNHAALAENDVKGLRVTLDRDNNGSEYEVEFRKGFTEYSYEINAATGEIISYEIDND